MSFIRRGRAWFALPLCAMLVAGQELGLPLTTIAAEQTLAQAAIPQADRVLDAGQQQYQKGQLREALTTYQKALAIYRQKGGSEIEQLRRLDGEGTAVTSIGLIYARLGQYQKGLETLQEAAKIQEATIDRASKIKEDPALQIFFRNRGKLRSTLSFLGMIHYRLGQYQKALELNQDALSRSGRSPGDYALDGEIFNHIGNVYVGQGQTAKALEAYYSAMLLLDEVGYPLGRDISKGGKPINFIQANQAIYSPQRPQGRALTDYLEQSLKLDYHAPVRMHPWARSLFVTTLNNLGDAYGGRSQAQFFYLKALESSRFVQDLESEATSLNNVGTGYGRAGQAQTAQEYFAKALAVSQKLGNRALEGRTLNNLGASLLQTGKYLQATERLTAAVEAFESLRPGLSDENFRSLFETQTQIYESLQRALVAQNKSNQALEVAERGRARAFVELLARRLKPVDTATTVKSLTIAQIGQVAKSQRATLVEYSVIGNEALYIWVVKPSGEVAFRQVDLKPVLANGRTLADYVESVRSNGIGVRGRGAVASRKARGGDRATSADLQQLYQLLIAPIADQLPSELGSRVVFIPQGALFLVPFAALQNPSGKYLIEQYTISLSPSIQVLQLTGTEGKTDASKNPSPSPRLPVSPSSSLIVGNPTMPKIRIEAGRPPEPLSDLPGAEIEAKAIASLLKTNALTGKQATEGTVVKQMVSRQVVHLATHGLLDDFKGLGIPGAIALAPDSPTQEQGDGLLTANEILDLKLNADLVVLSACDTGRGRITGDGVVGLSRSLLSVGASSVVVSLWAVPDAPTASLMTEFYQALLQKPDKAEALRQAMLTTLKQYPEPRDWAAFALIGNGE